MERQKIEKIMEKESALIGGIVAIIVLIWKNWDKVSATMLKFWDICKNVFSSVSNYIKNNFLNVLLMAINPIYAIIQGLKQIVLLKQGVKGLKGIVFKNESIPQKTPPLVKNNLVGGNNKNGRIDIGVKVDSPNANTSTTLDLENPSGMTLIPNR